MRVADDRGDGGWHTVSVTLMNWACYYDERLEDLAESLERAVAHLFGVLF